MEIVEFSHYYGASPPMKTQRMTINDDGDDDNDDGILWWCWWYIMLCIWQQWNMSIQGTLFYDVLRYDLRGMSY